MHQNCTIQIESLNVDHVHTVDSTGPMYVVYFLLSATPTAAWKEMFDIEWQKMGNKTSVQHSDPDTGKSWLSLLSPLNDISSVHLPVLREAIEQANLSHAEYLDGKGS